MTWERIKKKLQPKTRAQTVLNCPSLVDHDQQHDVLDGNDESRQIALTEHLQDDKKL